jgi:transposase
MWTPENRALVGDYGCGQALSDDQFRLLEPLIPPPKPGGRPRTTDIRRTLDGVFYVVRTGCQWRHRPPPPAFPPWRTVYGYFRDFIEAGVWESMRHHLLTMVGERDGREPSPSVAIIDTQSVKTTEKQPCLFRVDTVGESFGLNVSAAQEAGTLIGTAKPIILAQGSVWEKSNYSYSRTA